MELIDRYVYEVGRHLPPKNRGDIQVELRSLLRDNLEARVQGEASEEDVAAMLKEFGSPAKVAASYNPQSQYLVGPELFPTFRTVFGIAMLVTVVVYAVLLGLALFTAPEPLKILDLVSEFVGSVFSVLGTIVVIFFILQYFGVRVPRPGEEWDPRALPDVDARSEVKRSGIIVDIAFDLLLLVLVLVFPTRLGVVVTPGTPVLTDPVILRYIPLIVAALLAGLVVNIVLLWRGRWQLSTRLAKLAANLFSIFVLAVLIAEHSAWLSEQTGSDFFGLLSSMPEWLASIPEQTLLVAMYFIQWGLVIALIVMTVETVELGYRTFRQVMGWDNPLPLEAPQG